MSALDYKGSLSIGGVCPLVVSASAAAFADLQARVTGLLALQAQLTLTPPALGASITLVGQLLAQLQAALSLSITFPSASLQLAAIATLVATLEAQLALLLQLQVLFGASGIYVWEFEGRGPELGPLLTSELAVGWPGGASAALPANAIVLATVTPATWTAMKTFFGGG